MEYQKDKDKHFRECRTALPVSLLAPADGSTSHPLSLIFTGSLLNTVHYKSLLYVYKAIHGLVPGYLQDLVEIQRPSRTLRSSSKMQLVVPKSRTVTYGDRSFHVAAARHWNVLPEQLKNFPLISQYKKQLKTHFFKKAYNI